MPDGPQTSSVSWREAVTNKQVEVLSLSLTCDAHVLLEREVAFQEEYDLVMECLCLTGTIGLKKM